MTNTLKWVRSFGLAHVVWPIAAVVGLCVFSVSLNSHLNERSLRQVSGSLVRIHESEETLAQLMGDIQQATSTERAYFLTGDSFYFGPYKDALVRANHDLARLREVSASSRHQTARMNMLEPAVHAKIDELNQSLSMLPRTWKKGAVPNELALNAVEMSYISNLIAEMKAADEGARQTQEAAAVRRNKAATWLNTLDLFTIVLLICASAAVTLRSFRQRNITLAKLEAALNASKDSAAFIDTAMHALHDGLIVTNVDGEFEMCNGSAERILALSRSQIMGTEPLPEGWRILDEDGQEYPPEMHNLSSILEAGLFQRGVVLCIISSDHSVRWVRVNADPLRSVPGSERHGTVATLADVTQQKLLENDLRTNEIKLQESNLELELQKKQLETAFKGLESANGELEALATRDGLTGLMNHRAFQSKLREELKRAQRYHKPFSLILMDVDNFKGFNDTFGHPAGDQVLRKVAQLVSAEARTSDIVARYGGEEFVILLPSTDLAGAELLAERMRAAIEQSGWPLREVTGSFGVSDWNISLDAPEVIERADQAMYLSKSNGRNKVSVFLESGPPKLKIIQG